MEERKASQMVEELFDTWYPCVVRYAASLIGSTDRAEDIVQESFFALYRALRLGKVVVSPKAWTATVVRRLVYQERSKAGAFDSDIELNALMHEPVAPADDDPFAQDDVRRLLDVLTGREKEVVLLRLASLRYREIAERLGIQTGTIGPLLARALRKLRIAADRPSGRLEGPREYRRDAGKTLH